MLVKNVLKGIKHKPFRIIGIISMVLLAGLLYVSLGYTLVVANDSLQNYVKDYNQEDFSFEMNPYLSTDESSQYGNVQYLYQLSVTEKQKVIADRIQYLEQHYQINIEERDYKQINFLSTELNKTVTLRVFKNNKEIDKTYVEKGGRLPASNNEIALGVTFAEKNQLKLNDTIMINNTNYTIVGFIYLVDYIYPQLSSEGIAFDASNQVLGVLSDSSFDAFQAPGVTYYAGDFLKNTYTKKDVENMNNFYMTNLVDAKTAFRTGAIDSEITADGAMINALSGVLLVLAVVVIGIVVNKSINAERVQIGVIKSLGYSHSKILKSYMIYPFVASIIGSIFGYFLGYLLAIPIINFFHLYYQMPMGNIHFSFSIFIIAIILPIIALNLFSAIVIYFLVRKAPLDLMKIKVNNKVGFLVRKLNHLLKRLSFKVRFKYSIALRGVGKLAITFVGVLIASIYLVFALSFSQSFSTILGSASPNSDYKYQVIFDQPTNTEKEAANDRFMEIPSSIVVKDKAIDVTLMGIDEQLNRYALVDKNNNDLSQSLYENENNVVITSMLAMIDHIKVNDYINIKTTTLDENNQETDTLHQVKVVGIMENYSTPYVFTQLKTLNGYYNLDSSWYNGVWTNTKITDHVKTIFDKDEMMQSIDQMMGMVKSLIYVLVGVAVLLAIIVLILIAIFNIEDNFKTISYFKVMGYSDKEVSQMVLNIYLPIVILAYLFSIPLTLLSLRSLMTMVSSSLNFALPFNLSFVQTIVGLVIILITYYFSQIIARRKLNKISLQEALKYNE